MSWAVSVRVDGRRGTATVISPRLALTCWHVVKDAPAGLVLAPGARPQRFDVADSDRELDVALLVLAEDGARLVDRPGHVGGAAAMDIGACSAHTCSALFHESPEVGFVHSSGIEDAGFVAARRIVTFNAASDTAGGASPSGLSPIYNSQKGSS